MASENLEMNGDADRNGEAEVGHGEAGDGLGARGTKSCSLVEPHRNNASRGSPWQQRAVVVPHPEKGLNTERVSRDFFLFVFLTCERVELRSRAPLRR